MSSPYLLLAAFEALTVIAYGWTIARPASRLGSTTACAGAVAIAAAFSLVSVIVLQQQDMGEAPMRNLVMIDALSILMPVLAVTGTALVTRSMALPPTIRAIAIVLVLAIAHLVGQHYAVRYDFIQAVAQLATRAQLRL